jgi:hypothetical protein
LTRCRAGINIAINNAMMAMTTKSSIKVNAFPLRIPVLLLSKKVLPNQDFSPEIMSPAVFLV